VVSYGASRRRDRKERRERKGQSLVELCLVLPFLIMLVAGVMDVGLLIYAHLELTHAAQEVTKLAGMNRHTAAQLTTIFNNHITIRGTPAITVTTTANDASLDNRPSVTVNMSLTFPPIGLAQVFRASDITFTSSARMPVITHTGGGLHPDMSP
jgi:Flp pilus assembly protein TadG